MRGRNDSLEVVRGKVPLDLSYSPILEEKNNKEVRNGGGHHIGKEFLAKSLIGPVSTEKKGRQKKIYL